MITATSTCPRTATSGISALEAAHALTQLVGASFPSISSPREERKCIVSEDESSSSCAESSSKSKTKRTRKTASASSCKKAAENFPTRLMNMLSDPAVRDAITWLPHGQAFVVLRPDVFAESVLPLYFPESAAGRRGNNATSNNKAKYPSFTRKLNRWGFRQINKGPDAGAFRNPLFRRDAPELSRGMECQKSSGRGNVTQASGADKKRVEVEVGVVEKELTAAACLSSHRVPLKKRKLSHLPSPTSFAVSPSVASVSSSSLASTCFTASSSSSSVSSLSETPLLPKAGTPPPLSRMPRRVSSLSETAALPAQNQQWHHHQTQGPGQQRHNANFDATLRQLQASMEKARAAKKFWAQVDGEQQARPLGGTRSSIADPVQQPRPTNPEQQAKRSSAEEHKSMLYKAFLQAMHQ